MSTALDASIRRDRREMFDRRTVNIIMGILNRFIPDACRREAIDVLAAAVVEGGYELTNRLEREQYESWKATVLAGDLPMIETK